MWAGTEMTIPVRLFPLFAVTMFELKTMIGIQHTVTALAVLLSVSLVDGFTIGNPSWVVVPRSSSTTRLFVIDEAAVAAAVKIPGVDEPIIQAAPKLAPPPTPPTPAPAVELPPAPVPGMSSPEEPAVVVAPVAKAPAPAPAATMTNVMPKPPPPPPPSAAVSLPSMDLNLPAGLSAPLIGGGLLAAFAAATFAMRQSVDEENTAAAAVAPAPAPASTSSSSTTSNLSIPYDAAARLAYDEWRAKFNKGAFDSSKYETFKANYEAVAVANVTEKKKAKDTGSTAKSYALDEAGDQPGGADKVLG